jgi:hypothetical protein
MKVFTDLKTRGCQDILIAVTVGLKGMSEAPTRSGVSGFLCVRRINAVDFLFFS